MIYSVNAIHATCHATPLRQTDNRLSTPVNRNALYTRRKKPAPNVCHTFEGDSQETKPPATTSTHRRHCEEVRPLQIVLGASVTLQNAQSFAPAPGLLLPTPDLRKAWVSAAGRHNRYIPARLSASQLP